MPKVLPSFSTSHRLSLRELKDARSQPSAELPDSALIVPDAHSSLSCHPDIGSRETSIGFPRRSLQQQWPYSVIREDVSERVLSLR